ncbi:preprotein translocase subunit YajC [Pacificimonas sp. ICDLI1SI03]|jgi:preprotein translocase subunit YajC|tara:strand:+ start:81667 stop:82005 length:339 start_codon:yes stop_codon:yes gene_type:complete
MFSFPAYAQAAGASGGAGGFLNAIMPLLLIIPIFYFLLIRPQQRRMKAHKAMIDAVKKNDTVVTGGGLIGKVKRVTETEIDVDLGNGNVVKVVKGTLSEVRQPGTPAAAAND